MLLSSKTKFKAGDERQAYGIERPEPLLYFALSAGSHSDPAVINPSLYFFYCKHAFYVSTPKKSGTFAILVNSYKLVVIILSILCLFRYQVRIFTPKRIFQELEAAKEDYIRATFGIRKDHKVLLPKIVESFAKDSGVCQAGILEMIQQCLPDSLRKSLKKCQQQQQQGKSRKNIEWAPHNFGFRYLILKEMK